MPILRSLVFTLNVSLLAACAAEPTAPSGPTDPTGAPSAGPPATGEDPIAPLAHDPPG